MRASGYLWTVIASGHDSAVVFWANSAKTKSAELTSNLYWSAICVPVKIVTFQNAGKQ